MNRKFDRFRQWGRERMGGEIKTNQSDNFKAMESEMNVRHEGESCSILRSGEKKIANNCFLSLQALIAFTRP